MSSAAPRPRRVLLVSDHGATGGTRDYLLRLLDFYAGLGAQVSLVCTDPHGRDVVEGTDAEVLGLDDVLGAGAVPASPWSERARRAERPAWARFAAAGGFDLVVASVGTPGSLLAAVQASRPSLYLLHTYPHGPRVRLLGRTAFGHALDDVTRMVTVSQAAREAVVRGWGLGRTRERVGVVHSTAGPVLTPPADDGRDTVLAIGHVEHYKGPDTFIALARALAPRHPGVRFVWAGDGSLIETCRAQVRAIGLDDRIAFVGHRTDIDALYAQALVYVQPSRVESLGLALLDASRHGVPSVVPAVGGMPEVVVDGRTGTVVPAHDPTALADAVGALLSSPQHRTALGHGAHAHYGRAFSEQAWTANMTAVHADVLRSH